MGKPLISNAAMRTMYATMRQMRACKRDVALLHPLSRAERTALQAEPESLLAALLSQLHRQDTILTDGSSPLLATAMNTYFQKGATPATQTCHGSTEECAAIATGMALRTAQRAASAAKRTSGREPAPRLVVVALLQRLPPLTGVLSFIEQHDLAVLLVADGEPESRVDARRRLLSTKVPVMPVDRADAVAVCRVVQEALLRARNGWGGAVIHATAMPGSGDPILLLRQHMVTRGLLEGSA